MSEATQRKPRPQLVCADEPDISFYHADRLEPGEYTAFCRSARVYRDRKFQRWQCVVQFDVRGNNLMEVIGRVSWFLNLGSGDRPRAGRRGNYWHAWVDANGGLPKRRNRLSPRVFERRLARIVVGDVVSDFRDRKRKLHPENYYSVVRGVTRWETGPTNQ